MNPEELEGLLQELMQAVQQVMQSGEELSDEFQGVLAQTIGNLYERIEQSRQQPEQPPTQDRVAPPPHYDSRLLWILSGRNPEAFTQYLRTYPTAGTANLLANPDLLNSTIQQLSASMPPGEHETLMEGDVPHADLQSSNIWGALYNQKTGKMKVRFQGGSEYEYDGVPKNIFNAFIHGQASARTDGENQYGRWWKNKNPSLGASFNQYIKEGNFPFRRIR